MKAVAVSSIPSSFNSRTLGGVRHQTSETHKTSSTFQFTHPGRGATACFGRDLEEAICFNSRTLGGVRHLRLIVLHLNQNVSIHAPWEGCDHELTAYSLHR